VAKKPPKDAVDAVETVEAGGVVDLADANESPTTALAKITEGLPPDVVARVERLLQVMDPNKPGFEEMGGARWSPPIVKVYQPVSSDVPGNAKQGDLFTDTGDVLPASWEFVPIYMHYSHARFEPGNNSPTCRSEDAKKSIYGDVCADCADLPFRDGQRTTCNKSLDVYAFDKDFSQVYHLQFSKTSYRAGSKLFKQASSSTVPWARVYALGTEQKSRQNDQGKYYVLTVKPTGDQVDTKFFPVVNHIYEQISAVRKKVLANIAERADTGKKVVDNLPEDFGGATDGDAKTDAPEPDFGDM